MSTIERKAEEKQTEDDAHQRMRSASVYGSSEAMLEMREDITASSAGISMRYNKTSKRHHPASEIHDDMHTDTDWFSILSSHTEVLKWQAILAEEVHCCYSEGFHPTLKGIAGRIRWKHMMTHDRPHPVSHDIVRPLVQHLAGGMPHILYTDVVVMKESGFPQFAYYLHKEPDSFPGFVDQCSLDDPYDDQFWSQFRKAVTALHLQNRHLPTGLDFAKLLRAKWPHLERYQLAEVLRMMKLAIPRKIFAMRRGVIVPFQRSVDLVVEADLCPPSPISVDTATSPKNALQPIKSLIELENVVSMLFQTVFSNPKLDVRRGISLTVIRAAIKNLFSKTISLEMLEHSSLSNLFSDSRLQHMLCVERTGDDVRVFPARFRTLSIQGFLG